MRYHFFVNKKCNFAAENREKTVFLGDNLFFIKTEVIKKMKIVNGQHSAFLARKIFEFRAGPYYG